MNVLSLYGFNKSSSVWYGSLNGDATHYPWHAPSYRTSNVICHKGAQELWLLPEPQEIGMLHIVASMWPIKESWLFRPRSDASSYPAVIIDGDVKKWRAVYQCFKTWLFDAKSWGVAEPLSQVYVRIEYELK
jgi:hypothetical protein